MILFTYTCVPDEESVFPHYEIIEVSEEERKNMPDGIPLFKTKDDAIKYSSFALRHPQHSNQFERLIYKDECD